MSLGTAVALYGPPCFSPQLNCELTRGTSPTLAQSLTHGQLVVRTALDLQMGYFKMHIPIAGRTEDQHDYSYLPTMTGGNALPSERLIDHELHGTTPVYIGADLTLLLHETE